MHRKHRELQLSAKVLKKLGTNAVVLLVRGTPVKKALQELGRWNPDLVVVGKHGRGRL